MTDVAFYHLERSRLEQVLPKLLEKTLDSGKRAVVISDTPDRVEYLNALLWTYDPASWLPHGAARDGEAEEQAIWLTASDENPNHATFLFLTDGAGSDAISTYERCFDLFDGNNPDSVSRARERWKSYKAEGFNVTYWRQGERGWAQQNA